MLIRSARSLDLPAIAALHVGLARELRALATDGFGAPLDNMPGAGEVTGKFRDMIDDPDCCLYVAEEAGRIVALGSGWRETHGDDLIEAPFFTIEFVEVHPDFRGQGLAQQLIAVLEDTARRLGITHVDLLVWDGNAPARELYGKLGYAPLEHRLGKVLS